MLMRHIGRGADRIQFTSYREDGCPDRQITARISDRTHWVDVFFDVNATDEFEK